MTLRTGFAMGTAVPSKFDRLPSIEPYVPSDSIRPGGLRAIAGLWPSAESVGCDHILTYRASACGAAVSYSRPSNPVIRRRPQPESNSSFPVRVWPSTRHSHPGEGSPVGSSGLAEQRMARRRGVSFLRDLFALSWCACQPRARHAGPLPNPWPPDKARWTVHSA